MGLMYKKDNIMKEEEYLTVNEIIKKTQLSSRHVRRIINQLSSSYNSLYLYKDDNEIWKIHNTLEWRFRPIRNRKTKYYALTIDPCSKYSEMDLHKIMSFVFEQMGTDSLEINYTIESKKATGVNHLHCYVKCNNKKRLLDVIRIAFSELSYHEAIVYDLEGWKAYMTKENKKITTLSNPINHV
jgi:hydroxymethylpyrimidine pyrophosphatase-like HAD family hydrolase